MSVAIQKAEEPSSLDGAWNAALPSSDERRTASQRILVDERERLRRIEATLGELTGELCTELLQAETRLGEVERELAERTEELDLLRSQLAAATPRPTLFSPESDDGAADNAAATLSLDTASTLDTQDCVAQSQLEQEELRAQLSRAHKQLNLRAQELNELRAELSSIAAMRAGEGADAEAFAQELIVLRTERQQLVEQLAVAESKLRQVGDINLEEIDIQRRRFEMAVQDVRELKARNSRLEEQLAEAKRSALQSAVKPVSNGQDWESLKQKMLQRLESDYDPHDILSSREKISIEGTVRITDSIVAQKDRELQELRELLERSVVPDTEAAIDQLLNRDEIIAREREKLTRLQNEMNDKLRKAEIELSVERATLARERTSLDERRRALDEQRDHLENIAASLKTNGELPNIKPQARGRWLARLGLKD